MGSLGDFFPQEFRREAAIDNIGIGCVIKCFVANTKPPKEKRIVIVGQDNDGNFVGCVFINSNLHAKILNTQSLLDQQHLIKHQENSFIDYDSYVDCGYLFQRNREELISLLESEPDRSLGKLMMEDLETILSYLKKSATIEPKLLKKFGLL
ncbi:MAG: hypothetical protein KF870_07340 [Leadbetterella sp.]|nr:hypothetical protein [Leadbetterella sp.]